MSENKQTIRLEGLCIGYRGKHGVKEVAKDYECGVQLEKFNDIKEGDIIEAFILKEIKR